MDGRAAGRPRVDAHGFDVTAEGRHNVVVHMQVSAYEAAGDYARAVERAAELLAIDLWDEEAHRWRDGTGKRVRRLKPPHSFVEPTRRTRVVLATGHRDHDPTNNDPANLAAWCQRCHILHDKAEHLRRRRLTYLARRALGDLFTGPYRHG